MKAEDVRLSVSIIYMIGDVPEYKNSVTGLVEAPAKPNSLLATGTCFFYRSNDKSYVVTNSHVLNTERSHSVNIRLSTANAWMRYSVPLRDEQGKKRWKSHARADIALLPFEPPAHGHFTAWSKSDVLPDNYHLELAEPVICVGYPMKFYDDENNRPVLRHGSIASEYSKDFRNQPYFLTDAIHFPGNSGTPVITRERQTWKTKEGGDIQLDAPSCLLAGVHSRREFVQGREQGDVDLGLGVTWYAKLIEEIATTF